MIEDQVYNQPETNLKAEITRYTRNWYWFVLGIIGCLSLAFLYLRYTTPVYQTSAELLVKDDKKGGATDAMGTAFQDLGLLGGGKNVDNEIRVLKSKSLLERTLRKLPSLQPTQFVEGNIRTSEAYGGNVPFIVKIDTLFEDSLSNNTIGIFKISVKDDKTSYLFTNTKGQAKEFKFGQKIVTNFGRFSVAPNPDFKFTGDNYIIKFNNIKDYAASYNNKISVEASAQQTSTIIISVKDPVPAKSVDIINKLIGIQPRCH
ncbi:Wzz/FepE/Etk N-terminal domain-containing protein [Niabella ginsengisoli]|uniref:Wzz/FepE/Etk N-terminal domain-containing protein n=1 Tax=Niabella ginsengisoli TaxID=522298 RepID=A0ABS9SK18_9BACT|nr:Wzz/FepE/Etk N-terminal domain-containing protein [Niabella ginsengisoli]MCH5598719.1 Wzz/FepE/Etk N-terminal domain-containing protein [Niabella ginsengisoli]